VGIARTGRVEAVVHAPVDAVWRVVADVTRTGQWSHECRQVRWLDKSAAVASGVRFRGRNRSGWLRWSRVCEIVSVQPSHELVWRILRTALLVDSTEWRITLEPTGDGTRIVESYRVVTLPRWFEWLVTHLNPSHVDRTAALSEDLHRLGDLAASETASLGRP
jgi:uncharacterized protein YndB with AHSA1/START domain